MSRDTAAPPARLRRVGHKGADLIVPGNTLASFDAALQAGVDMIEFDVLSASPDGSGDLLIAHDYRALARREPVSLERALAHLATPPFASLEFDVDLKLPGYELRVLEALRDAGLLERSLVSSMYPRSLRVLRAAAPALRLGWSVPRVKRDWTGHRSTLLPALVVLAVYRAALPTRARRALRAGQCNAIMAHWRLVTPALARAVASAGGELYAWTVDDAAQIARMHSLGASAVISNDPRLFQAGPITQLAVE